MATTYILAPNARWQGRNQTGQPCINGKLYTYVNQTTTPKPTYQDYEGKQANENPIRLDGKGEANIYWDTLELYTIKLFTETDQEVYTQDNYPFVGQDQGHVQSDEVINFVRNPQFYFWDFYTDGSDVRSASNPYDYCADEWVFYKTSSDSVINITREEFALDQTEVPANPTYFFRYECSVAGTGETRTYISQVFKSVRTLANQTVTLSFYAKSSNSSTLLCLADQNFGTGGSPSSEVSTLLIEADLTTDWQQFVIEDILIPDIDGKTLGTNGDDALYLEFRFPNNEVTQIDICNVYLQRSDTLADFPIISINDQSKRLDAQVSQGVFTTGDVKATLKTTADAGWLMMNDQTIGKIGSAATSQGNYLKDLYQLLYAQVNDTYAPVSGGRTGNSNDDWNAGKTITLTKILGRVLGSAGTGSGLSARVTGETTGEETHLLNINEMPSHRHEMNDGGAPRSNQTGGSTAQTGADFGINATQLSFTGNDEPHNNMQPTLFLRYMMKI